MKSIKKLAQRVTGAFAVFTAFIAMTFSNAVMVGATDVDAALKKSGIKQTGSFEQAYADFGNILTIVFTIGGFLIVGFIAFGAILLAGSTGNPQRRMAGIGSLLCSLIGAWVLYKAPDLAGWATGIGGAKK